MCGEKGSYRGFELSLRGKVLCLSLCIDFLGITPAYAGKSCIFVRLSGLQGDHPRVCGEKMSSSHISSFR